MTKRESNRKWQQENPDKFRTYRRTYRLNNPEKVKEQKRKWRLSNMAKVALRSREARQRKIDQYLTTERNWAAKNREKMNEACRKHRLVNHERCKILRRKDRSLRRARLRVATIGDLAEIQKIYNRCAELGQWFKGLVVDHIIPLARGGTHEASNLQIIYDFENRTKNARLDYKPRVVFV